MDLIFQATTDKSEENKEESIEEIDLFNGETTDDFSSLKKTGATDKNS